MSRFVCLIARVSRTAWKPEYLIDILKIWLFGSLCVYLFALDAGFFPPEKWVSIRQAATIWPVYFVPSSGYGVGAKAEQWSDCDDDLISVCFRVRLGFLDSEPMPRPWIPTILKFRPINAQKGKWTRFEKLQTDKSHQILLKSLQRWWKNRVYNQLDLANRWNRRVSEGKKN